MKTTFLVALAILSASLSPLTCAQPGARTFLPALQHSEPGAETPKKNNSKAKKTKKTRKPKVAKRSKRRAGAN